MVPVKRHGARAQDKRSWRGWSHRRPIQQLTVGQINWSSCTCTAVGGRQGREGRKREAVRVLSSGAVTETHFTSPAQNGRERTQPPVLSKAATGAIRNKYKIGCRKLSTRRAGSRLYCNILGPPFGLSPRGFVLRSPSLAHSQSKRTCMGLPISRDVRTPSRYGRSGDGDIKLRHFAGVEGHLSEGQLGQGRLAGDEASQSPGHLHLGVRPHSPARRQRARTGRS